MASEALEASVEQGPKPGRPAIPEAVVALLKECFVDPTRRPAGRNVIAQRLVALYKAQLGRRYPRRAAEVAAHLARLDAAAPADLGQAEMAEPCWQQMLRADPRHPDATYNWGLTRWWAARITNQELVEQLEAVRAAHAAAGTAEGCTEYLLGPVHLERGDVDAAAQLLGRLGEAAQRAPSDSPQRLSDALPMSYLFLDVTLGSYAHVPVRVLW